MAEETNVTTLTGAQIEAAAPFGVTKEQLEAIVAASAPAQTAPVKPKKVAILGFVEHYKLAPFDDPDFEIWGLNELYQFLPRWTRWFEMHSRRVYENDRQRTSDHITKLKAMTCPVYMHQHWDDIPASVPFPLEAVLQAFPNPSPGAKPYLTNSITYMILLAVLEGFEEIHVYGVDMAASEEYGTQRPSCEWAVGIAQGRGIKVYIPPAGDLLKTLWLYGYEEEACAAFDAKMKQRLDDLNRKVGEADAQIAQLTEARAQYRGASQDAQHILTNWKSIKTL